MADKKNIYSNFNFCGELVFPKKNGPWVKRETFNGKDKISMNLGIKAGNNIGYIKADCWKNDVIKTKDINNKNYDVDWEDRLDEDIIKGVSTAKRYVVSLDERKEFITAWDMIEYLETALEGYTKPIVATGSFVIRPGTGKSSDKTYREFSVQNIYAATDKNKPLLTMNAELFYDRNSLDRASEKTDGKIYLNAYTPQWVNSDLGRKMFPITVVLDKNILKDHPDWIDYKLGYMETKSRNPVHMNWDIGVVNGAEEVEFSIDTLTDAQRRQVELGVRPLEYFRKRGQIMGERVSELRVIVPHLEGEFADSMTAEDSGMTAREFEDEIYTPVTDESVDDMVNDTPKSKTVAKPAESEEDIESIF